jgi:signal transduction histidine kinase
VLEQILFDISHVIRRPASSIIGLTDMIQADIQSGNLDSASQMIQLLKSAAGELDDFIHQLNEAYVNRRQSLEQKRRA